MGKYGSSAAMRATMAWEGYKEMWPMALANHEVPYFHMREMADPNGVFKKWHPFNEHYDEVADFFSGLTKVIGYCHLRSFFSIARFVAGPSGMTSRPPPAPYRRS
jgi:hypothetical protein